jgi:hypothetical protein
MTQPIALFGYKFAFAPTLLQRRLAGRLACILIAVPLSVLAFAPVIMQTAQIW